MLYGMTTEPPGGGSGDGTVFALNIAPASVGLTNVSNATIISGGTTALGMRVSNSPSSGYNLNYTLSTAVQSGNATLGSITFGTGSLVPSSSQSCTVSSPPPIWATMLFLSQSTLFQMLPIVRKRELGPYCSRAFCSEPFGGNWQQSNGHRRSNGHHCRIEPSNGTSGPEGIGLAGCQFAGHRRERSNRRSLVASGSSQSYTATLNTSTLGTQTQTFSLNVGDDQTLSGASAPIIFRPLRP